MQSQQRRAAIRTTWARHAKVHSPDVDIRIFLAQPAAASDKSSILARRQAIDILQVRHQMCVVGCFEISCARCKPSTTLDTTSADRGVPAPCHVHCCVVNWMLQEEVRGHSDVVMLRGEDAYDNLPKKTVQ